MDWRCHTFPHPSKQQEPEPDPAPEVPAVPRTAEEPNAKTIADAAAAAVKKAGEDAFRAAEKNKLAAAPPREGAEAEKAARVLADRHKLQVGGERGDASNLQTALPKGFGCGLASKLRSEGSPFDVSYSYLLLFVSIVASSLRFGFFGLLFWLGSLWCGKPCSALELPSNIAAR
jgi:hypothetical protein